MTQILNETFTDASQQALSLHTSDSGHSWTYVSGTFECLVGNVVGWLIPQGVARYRCSANMGTTDYSVTAVIKRYANGYQDHTFDGGVCARYQSGADTCYQFTYSTRDDNWYLIRRLNGGHDAILWDGTNASTVTYWKTNSDQISEGDTATISIEVSGTGSSVSILCKKGGTTIFNVSDTHANRIVSQGYPGLICNTEDGFTGSGTLLDSISADTLGGGGGFQAAWGANVNSVL